jgi:hypothetical protein
MFKSLKHGKDIAVRIVFVMKMFWSFGFVSLGIVSNFVLRYSDFSRAKEKDYVGPFQGPSSSHLFYRRSPTSFFLCGAGLRANLFCLVGDLGEGELLTQLHDFCFTRGGF